MIHRWTTYLMLSAARLGEPNKIFKWQKCFWFFFSLIKIFFFPVLQRCHFCSIFFSIFVTFYKGQSIIIADNSPSIQLPQSNGILTSVDRNWVIGGLLLTACNILLTVWFVYQVYICCCCVWE